jgi:CBS domain-containing protein
MKVKDIMTTPVIDAHVDTPVTGLAELLAKHRISAVPITDDEGAVVGVVSEYDLLSRRGRVARDVMSPSVISVTEDTDVDDVRVLLIDRRIRRVPVLHGQHLVGIVSRSDLVELMSMEWTCEVCGEPVRQEMPPEVCPKCGASGVENFAYQVQPPGE